MPTYDYECTACDHTFEAFQTISEPHLKKCPKCRKNRLRRLIGTGAALLFKGSGFYKTDYRSESYKKGAAADTTHTASASSDGKKSDSKSDSKSESKPKKHKAAHD